VKRYPESLKKDLLSKMLRPGGPSATELATRTNVSQATLSRWVREASKVRTMSTKDESDSEQAARKVDRSTRDWTPADKLHMVQKTAGLDDAELGALLRREGMHKADLTLWREQVAEGALAGKRQCTAEQKHIRKLEAELKRKEKAVAEAAALLVLSKNVEALWGAPEGDDTTERSEP
jgi:transposase-like protein